MASINTTETVNVGSWILSSDRFLTEDQTLIMNITMGILGIVGNFIVCFVFLRVKSQLRTLTNMFILNQSVLDLFTSVVFLIRKTGPRIVVPVGVLGELYCKLWKSGYTTWSLLMASSLNLIVLTLERYLAVVHPIKHRNNITKRKVQIVIPFIWVVPALLELFWAFANYNDGFGNCRIEWYSKFVAKFSGVIFFLLELPIPLGVIIVVYTRIIFQLLSRSHNQETRDNEVSCSVKRDNKCLPEAQNCSEANLRVSLTTGGNSVNVTRKDKAKQKQDSSFDRSRRNVTKTMFIVSVVYVICWTPQSFWFFLFNVTETVPLYSRFHDIAVLLAFLNMCVNPVIYAFQYRQFRIAIMKAFNCPINKIADSSHESRFANTVT
ncbi:allatostatin-A receptor-like [Saccoglossus kowalevskii]|uniref:Allatostatin-A receptor-like n=1 Tax=Saccoglossus kowalevskii TaxID=10224 RepID=A0ABM0MN55_SACKO|nr:PREDICTED: allatostatin-A receptor-like [Saccoglossus kowalevskii]